MYLLQNVPVLNVPVAKHTTVVIMLLQNVPHDNGPDFAKFSVSKRSSLETDLLLKSQVLFQNGPLLEANLRKKMFCLDLNLVSQGGSQALYQRSYFSI